MQWRQEAHVMRGADVQRLVGEIRGHKSPEVLNHGTSCVAVKIRWNPRAGEQVDYIITDMGKRRSHIFTEFAALTDENISKRSNNITEKLTHRLGCSSGVLPCEE